MRLFYPIFLFVLLFSGIKTTTNAQVVINEFSCSNLDQFTDNFNKYEDWIELYNTSGSTVNLTGYYLSDDTLEKTKWKIPAGANISGNGFFRFWASGRNLVSGSHYYTNFKLTQTKTEFIVLSDPSGNIIDWLEIAQKTQLDHSYGRITNGSSQWGVFTNPTPNASNSTTSYADYADKPDVSMPAGFYTGSVTVDITTNEPNSVIRYTLDGTLPTASSTVYNGIPLTITTTSVLKAITFSTNPQILPSFMEFDTYFIDVTHTLRVVSVAGTQLTTLANGSGSVIPFGSFEYFDKNKQRTAKTYGEFNKHGQDSWANSQRSIDFVSRDEMGYNYAIKEKIFDSSTRDRFQRIILRASGDDNYPADHHTANLGSAHVRDAYIQNMAKEGGMKVDVRTGEKCIVYMNGTYWGVYDLRERVNDPDFTDYYYGQDKYDIQFIQTWGSTWSQYGGAQSLTDWNNFYSYIMSNNMADTSKYNYVMERYDAASLVDYIIINSFTVCSDWLNYNTGWWRGFDTTGTHLKWGYILWDNDATFDFYINYTGIPSTLANADPCDAEGLSGGSDPEGHIALLNKLRQNPDFEQYYISRQIDIWNTVFSCDNMLSYFDSVIASIDPEMNQHAIRWNGTYTEWQSNVQTLRNFISARCTLLSTGFIGCYNLNGPYEVNLDADPALAGSVQFNSLVIDSFPWNGTYFGGMDTKLEAMPYPGYTFVNWTANSQTFNPNGTAMKVVTDLTGNDSIVAHFSFNTTVPEDPSQNPAVGVYPTVFSEEALISFNLPTAAPVGIRIYTVDGRPVTELQQPGSPLQPGQYSVRLNLSGSSLAAGIYIVDFTAGKFHKSMRVYYGAGK